MVGCARIYVDGNPADSPRPKRHGTATGVNRFLKC